MASFLNGLSNFALELQGSTGDTTGQNLALLVEELLEELRVFVIHVLDTGFLEAAVLFLLLIRLFRGQIANLFILCHD